MRYLRHDIEKEYIKPIQRIIEFNKTQLQRFLRSLNYESDFYKDIAKDCKLLW